MFNTKWSWKYNKYSNIGRYYRIANTTFGEGKGVVISENGPMTWIVYDINRIQINGTILYKE